MDLNQIRQTLFGDDTEQVNKGIGYQPTQQPQQRIITSDEVDALTEEASSLHGVPKQLIRAIIDNESDRTPEGQYIASGKSRVAGHPSTATGLMQLINSTASAMGVEDSTDPRQNVMGGTKYLKTLLDRYNGDQEKAIAAYFKGPKTVDDWLKQNPNVRELPGDTGGTTVNDYIGRVSKNIQKYGGKLEVSSTSQLAPDDINNPDYLAKVLFGEVEPQQTQQAQSPIGQAQRAEPFSAPPVQPQTQRSEPFSMPGGIQEQEKEGIIPRLAKAWGRSVASLESGVGGALELTHIPGVKNIGQAVSEDAKAMREFYKVEDAGLVDQIAEGVSSGLQFLVPGVGVAKGAKVVSMLGNTANAAKIASWLGIGTNAVLEAAVESGNSYNALQEKGVDDKEATVRALGSFGANLALITATNAVGGMFGRNIDEVKKTLPQLIKEGAKKLPKEMLSEGFQESGQEVIGTVTEKEKLDAKNIALAGGLGALTAGIMSPVGLISENQQRKSAELETPSTIAEKTQPQQFDIVDEKGNVIPGAGRNEPPPIVDDNPLIGAGRAQEPVVSNKAPEQSVYSELPSNKPVLSSIVKKNEEDVKERTSALNYAKELLNINSVDEFLSLSEEEQAAKFNKLDDAATPKNEKAKAALIEFARVLDLKESELEKNRAVSKEEVIEKEPSEIDYKGRVVTFKGKDKKYKGKDVTKDFIGEIEGSTKDGKYVYINVNGTKHTVPIKKISEIDGVEGVPEKIIINKGIPEVSPTEIADVPSVQQVTEKQEESTVSPDREVALKNGEVAVKYTFKKNTNSDSGRLIADLENGYTHVMSVLSDRITLNENISGGPSRIFKTVDVGSGYGYHIEFKADSNGNPIGKGSYNLIKDKIPFGFTTTGLTKLEDVEKLAKEIAEEMRDESDVPSVQTVTETQQPSVAPPAISKKSSTGKQSFTDWHKEQEEKYGLTKNTEVTYNVAGVEKTGKFTGFTKSKTGDAKARISIKTDTGYSIASVSPSAIKGIKIAEKPIESAKKEDLLVKAKDGSETRYSYESLDLEDYNFTKKHYEESKAKLNDREYALSRMPVGKDQNAEKRAIELEKHAINKWEKEVKPWMEAGLKEKGIEFETAKKQVEEVKKDEVAKEVGSKQDVVSKMAEPIYKGGIEFHTKSGKVNESEVRASADRQAKQLYDDIQNKDIDKLTNRLLVLQNKASREAFEIATGIKLPNTVGGTTETIRKFVGEEKYDKHFSDIKQAQTVKAEEAKTKEYNAERDKLLDAKIPGGEGTYRSLIDNHAKAGFSVKVEKVGIREVYKLVKEGEPVSRVLPKKMIGEYALEKMPKYVEPAKSVWDILNDDLRKINKEIAKEKQFNKKVELNKKRNEIMAKIKKLDTGKEGGQNERQSEETGKETEALLKPSEIRKPTESPEAMPDSQKVSQKEETFKDKVHKRFLEKQAARNETAEKEVVKEEPTSAEKQKETVYNSTESMLHFNKGNLQANIETDTAIGKDWAMLTYYDNDGHKKTKSGKISDLKKMAKKLGYEEGKPKNTLPADFFKDEDPSVSEKITEETVKRDEALDRAATLFKKLGESFTKRDPNTMYSIGTEQAELAFEAVSAMVEAGYREFKIITLKIKEIAGEYIDNKNFQNAIEDAFDSYQEEDTTIPKRTETIEKIISQEVKDGRKDDTGTLETVEPKSTEGADKGTADNEGTRGTEEVSRPNGGSDKQGIDDDRSKRDLQGDSISESGGERVTAEPKKRDNSRNYIIDDSDNIGEGSVLTKARQTLDAIKLLKSLEEKKKKATKEEQAILAKFAGWGPLSGALVIKEEDVSYQWRETHKELKKLLTEEEFLAAKEASIDAHYTSPTVVRKMWDAVTKMGIKSGNILEPAAGVGTFFGLRPAKSKFNMVAVEMDSLSARITQQLYQGAEVNHSPYQKYFLPKNYFDLAISNVPFVNQPVFDENAKLYGIKNNQSVHNFYFAKTMHGVKPGGIMAFITSRYTLDAIDNLDVMKAITKNGNIIGAIRLPNDAFKEVANTKVVTDVIFVQKRAEDEPESPNNAIFREKTVITAKDRFGKDLQYNINSYYAKNPIMVVGEHSGTGRMYKDGEYTVVSKETFDSDLDIAFSNLPKNIAVDYDAKYRKSVADTIAAPSDITIGAHFIGPDGDVYMKKQSLDQPRPIGAKTNLSSKDKEIFKKLINLRTLARALFKKQIATNESIDADLKEINNAYDSFVKENGTLHSKSNVSLIGRDSDLSVVMAMENNDGTKGNFLLKRIVKEATAVSKVDTAEDAYILSLTEKGGIDFEYMSKISGKDVNVIRIELETAGLVFEDPDSFLRGNKPTYVGREEYLSGNVRLKLKQAVAAAEKDPKFSNNVTKLREVQPQDKGPGEITILPNSPILQEIDIGYFMYEVIIKSRNVDVKHDRQQGKWTVTADKGDPNNISYGVNYSDEAGGGGIALYGHEILQNILNNRPSEVKYTVEDAFGNKKTYTDQAATSAAKAKEAQIKEEFKKWIWLDQKRTDRIVKEFNDRFNCYQDRDYTHPARIKNKEAVVNPVGSTISLRPQQSNAVWRAIQTQNVLFAHEVGAGKTYACIVTAMEKKRLGLCKKSMIVVPNHLADQWGNDIISAYPGAKILVGNDQNFKASERKEFINKAAFGDYDIIVMRYSHFKKISVNPNIEAAYIQERVNALEDALYKQQAINKSGRWNRSSTKDEKDLIKKINSYKAKIFALTNVQRDVGIPYFDELGVDQIFVDEADNFKNLEYVSSIKKVLGMGNQAGSQQATDLIMKTRFIQKEGGGVVFATGTPVKNSLVEAYHMMRYLQPDYLKDNMLENFDEWQRVFAEPVTSFEQTASGLVQRTRFTKYNNVQELMAALRETWDIIDSQYLEDNKILVKGVNLPNVNRNVVEVNMSPVLEDYMEHLADRERSVKGKPPEKGGDNIMVIMMHGKLASTDIRTINKKAPKETNSKLTKVIDKAFDLYNKYSDKTGIIFYDQTAPKKGVKNSDRIGIEVLTEIKDQLVFRGVNPNDIAMIHEYAKKDLPKLKEAMDSGKKRILLGNTHRMGAGTNVQKKLKWEFHIDAPHRPGDITQREGRIIRQGNTNKDVEIYTFVTKGSFDATAWEMLNKKAKMIGSIMNGRDRKTNSFEEEDQFDQASIAALSNPLMMQRADLNQNIKELEAQAENLDTEIYKAKKVIKDHDSLKEYYAKALKSKKDILSENPPQPDGDNIKCTVNGVEFTSRKKAAEAVRKGFEDGKMVLKYGRISFNFTHNKEGEPDRAWFDAVDINGKREVGLLNKSLLFVNISRQYESVNDSIDRIINSIEVESKKLVIAKEKIKESTQPLRDKISELKTKLAEVIKEIEIYNAQKAAEKAARPAGEGVNWYALEEERKSQDMASEEDIKEEDSLDGNEENEDNKPEEAEKEDFSIPLEYEGYLEGINQAPEKEQFSVPLSPEPAPMPAKDVISTTKNAPHGKKVSFAVASNKIGKQMAIRKKGRDLSFVGAKDDFYQKMVDLTWPISKIEDAWADDVGADRKKIREIDVLISKVRGAGGMAKQFIEDNIENALNSLPGKIRSKVYTELNKYLIAKRTVWLYENKMNYVDAGIDLETAQTVVEFVETGAHIYSSEINRIAPIMWETNKKLLQIKRDHGVIDDELLWNLSEPYYVPFYRDVESTGKLNIPKGEKYTSTSKGIKRLDGSTTGIPIIEPVQNMMQNVYETFVNAYRADVMNKIIDFAESSEELGKMFEKVPPKWVKVGTIEYRGEVDMVLRPKLREFANKLGIVVEEKPKVAGHVSGKMTKVLGKSGGNKIEVMIGATEGNFSHELGHQLHKKYKKWVDPFIDSFVDELNSVADTRYLGVSVPASYVSYVRNRNEKFAEFVSMYITDRENLQEIAPQAFMEFETRIALDDNLRELIGFKPSNVKGLMTKEKDNWVMDWHVPKDREVVSVLREGKIVSYKCPEEVADAIKNMHPAMFPTWFRIFTLPMSWLRKGAVTLNIGFIIPNSVRDIQESAFNARTIPGYDFLVGLKEYLTNGDMYKQYYRLGGGMDSVESGTRRFNKSVEDLKYGNKYGKFLDQMYWKKAGVLKGTAESTWAVLTSPFDLIAKLGETSEMASRIGTYRRMVVGMPDWLKWYNDNVYNADQAIHVARQATVDFQRFGEYGRTANELIPFVNAAIQGYDKMVRTIKDDPRRALLAAFLYVFGPMMAFWLWNKDKEGYKAVPLQDKINNFIIMNPDEKTWVKIPKGHIVKFIGNPVQITMEKLYGTVYKDDASVIKQILSDVSPIDVSSIPVSLRLIIEPIANYDLYWNREIEKPYHKAILAAGERYDKKTNEAIKIIGKALNISPIMMQHEIEIVGAGTAKNILWFADIAMGKIDAERFGLERMPVTKSFYGKIGEWGTDIDQAISVCNKEIAKTRAFSVKKMHGYSGYSPEEIRKIGKANAEKIKLLYEKRVQLMKASEAIKHLRSTEE